MPQRLHCYVSSCKIFSLYPIVKISVNENRIYSGIYSIDAMILLQSAARFFSEKGLYVLYVLLNIFQNLLDIATYCWLAAYEYLSVNVL